MRTLAGLTVEGAARNAGAWLSTELWGADLATMSPAMSAYWLSVNSFGVLLVVIGMAVLWLDRRGITPPRFIAWTLGICTAVDAAVGPWPSHWPILLLTGILLLVGPGTATLPRGGLGADPPGPWLRPGSSGRTQC